MTFETVAADGCVRVVVLRGAGNRAFCVGADIGEFEQTRADKTQAVSYAEFVHDSVKAIQDCPHPIPKAVARANSALVANSMGISPSRSGW